MSKMRQLSLMIAPTLALACGGASSSADQIYTSELEPLFEESCVSGCHEAGGEGDELILGVVAGQSALLEAGSNQAPMKLISPGDREASYLWHKLQNTHLEVGGSGEPMPYATWPLPDSDLEVVGRYIDALK